MNVLQTSPRPVRVSTRFTGLPLEALALYLNLSLCATLVTAAPPPLPIAEGAKTPSSTSRIPSFLYALKDQQSIAQTVEKIRLDSRTRLPTMRTETPLKCMRIHAANSGELACLSQIVPQGLPNSGKLSPPTVHIYSADLRLLHSHPAAGNSPSRVQISADARMVGFTSFTIGTSYAGNPGINFMTATRIAPTDKPGQASDLKDWRLTQAGKVLRSPNVQYWGVSFAPQDSNIFYVSVYINDARHIARGDVRLRELTIIFTGAECPSVSPDGKRIAVKREIGSASWRPAVIALDTLALTEFEARNFADDQIAWFDNDVLMFQVTEPSVFSRTHRHTDTLDTRRGVAPRERRFLHRSRSVTPVFGRT